MLTEQNINWIAYQHGKRPLEETSINRIMNHGRYGFIIISANRSEIYDERKEMDLTPQFVEDCKTRGLNHEDENMQKEWLRAYNKKMDNELKKELQNSIYAYTPVYGGYHGTNDVTDSFEPSYVVYCHGKKHASDYLNWDNLRKYAVDLCRKYKQDSVYVQAPNESPVYLNGNGQETNEKGSLDNFKFNDNSQTYYTTIKRKKNNPQRFTADMGKSINTESKNYPIFPAKYKYQNCNPSCYSERVKRGLLGEVFVADNL